MENTLSQREVLDVATSIGYHMLKNGGEINRAEDTMERICLAYGMDAVHAFAISSTVIVSVEKDDISLSQTRRVKGYVTNLNKIEKYNALSRKICETLPTYNEIIQELKEIDELAPYPLYVSFLAYALIGGSFSVFFGGGVYEFLAGFLIGFVLRSVILLGDFLHSPSFFVNTAGAATTVLLSFLSSFLFQGIDTEIVNIGVLMNLVPGVLLTNCMRDFVAMDYMAGLAKIVEVILIALAIALGVAVSVLWR